MEKELLCMLIELNLLGHRPPLLCSFKIEEEMRRLFSKMKFTTKIECRKTRGRQQRDRGI